MPGTLFIINPVAARGTTMKRWLVSRREFIKAGIAFTEQQTAEAGEATRITRDAIKAGCQRVIAVGGDGTLNEVLNGYLDEPGIAINSQAAIGLLPSGTGSDFRRSVGLLNTADAVASVLASHSRLIDAMRVEYTTPEGGNLIRHSLNLVSFGLGGEVTGYVNNWRESLPGWVGGRLRFVAAAVLGLKDFKNKKISIRLDGRPPLSLRSNLVVIGNGRFAGGGMMLAPLAELDDGELDVILTHSPTRLDIIRELPRIYRGGLLENAKVSLHKAQSVLVEAAERLAIDIDGESPGIAPARVTVLPLAVRFLTGEQSA
jgi:diacylglycerol kinase (ATP)